MMESPATVTDNHEVGDEEENDVSEADSNESDACDNELSPMEI